MRILKYSANADYGVAIKRRKEASSAPFKAKIPSVQLLLAQVVDLQSPAVYSGNGIGGRVE